MKRFFLVLCLALTLVTTVGTAGAKADVVYGTLFNNYTNAYCGTECELIIQHPVGVTVYDVHASTPARFNAGCARWMFGNFSWIAQCNFYYTVVVSIPSTWAGSTFVTWSREKCVGSSGYIFGPAYSQTATTGVAWQYDDSIKSGGCQPSSPLN
jgi:hypothetical protein